MRTMQQAIDHRKMPRELPMRLVVNLSYITSSTELTLVINSS
jgi:hypothetical protein